MDDFTKWTALIVGAFSPLLKEFVMKHERVVFYFMLVIMVLCVCYGALLVAEKAKEIGLW